jgi:hypothetical protein
MSATQLPAFSITGWEIPVMGIIRHLRSLQAPANFNLLPAMKDKRGPSGVHLLTAIKLYL